MDINYLCPAERGHPCHGVTIAKGIFFLLIAMGMPWQGHVRIFYLTLSKKGVVMSIDPQEIERLKKETDIVSLVTSRGVMLLIGIRGQELDQKVQANYLKTGKRNSDGRENMLKP